MLDQRRSAANPRDDAGEPIEIVGAWNDITARKKIGEALVAAQDRLVRVLSSSSPAVIYSYKATGDYAPIIISENIKDRARAMSRANTLENADFWRDRVHPEDLSRVEAEIGSSVTGMVTTRSNIGFARRTAHIAG